jgi:hypothetical protein
MSLYVAICYARHPYFVRLNDQRLRQLLDEPSRTLADMVLSFIFVLNTTSQQIPGCHSRQVFLLRTRRGRKDARASFWHDRNGAGKMLDNHQKRISVSNCLFSQVKGEPPTYYKEGSKSSSTEWPPRFVKVAQILLPINLELNFRNLIVHFASCR